MSGDLTSEMGPRPIIIRVDNLPPGKNWKQIKYLIGGIIHHSNILKVKLLPLMTSLVPPFIPFQSCIVTLKPTLDEESFNDLLLELNTYQWDYYNMYAYALPPPPIPSSMGHMPSIDLESSSDNELSSNDTTPKTPNNAFLYPFPIPGPLQGNLVNTMGTGIPTMTPAGMMNPGNGPLPPQPMMGMPTQRRRYYQPPIMTFNQRAQYSQNPNYQRLKNNSLSAYSYYPINNRDLIPTEDDPLKPMMKLDNGHSHKGSGNSRGLKQIFNERSFRKQMTGRGMFQIQVENFPPFLKLETLEALDNDMECKLGKLEVVETSQPDKYGRLKWTVLKDFIKLKCPKLLNLQEKSKSHSDTSQDGVNPNNTREFYVGVYEDDEIQVQLNILQQESDGVEYNTPKSNKENEPIELVEEVGNYPNQKTKEEDKQNTDVQKNVVNAVIYKAIVGFNDKELYDECFENLLDQEYSLGYKLKVKRLAPFVEKKTDNGSNDTTKGNRQNIVSLDAQSS